MQGTFLPVKRLFKIDQYVFELVLGSDIFLAIFEKYSCFQVSVKLLKFFGRELNFFKQLLLLTEPLLFTKRLNARFLSLIVFFDTTSYPRWVPTVKCYSFVRNEIANNTQNSFVEKQYFFIYINIMKTFFPVVISKCALNTFRIP